MTVHQRGRTRRSRWAVVRAILRRAHPPWGRLAVATGLGVAGAAATVGLLAGSGAVVDRAAARPGLGAIAGLLAAVEVLAFARGPLRYGERLVGHDAAFRVLGRWRVWLYDRLEPLVPAGLGPLRSGDVLARAVDDVDALQDLYLRSAAPLVVAVCTSALAVTVTGLLVPPAAAVVGGALLVAMVGPAWLGRRLEAASAEEVARRGEMAADVVELLQGSAELVAFGAAGGVLERIGEADAALTAAARRRALAGGAASALVVACLGVAVVGVLALAVAAARAHRLEPVMVAVLPLTAIGAFEAVGPVALAVLRLGEVLAAASRLIDLEDLEVPVEDPASPAPLPAGCPEVALSEVTLRYDRRQRAALDAVSLTVPAGAKVAVVGRSGAGKSSLVNLLLRFWPKESGRATLGGVLLEELAQDDVRKAVGLLDQDADLFSGTIADNLALGHPGAGPEALAEALAAAQLEDWVSSLPQGLATEVGEHGTAVSGGQRQRIALARTLLHGASVLVLDEPTASLDEEAGRRLLDDVLEATSGRSVLLVTHRPSELDPFDDVVELAAGQVVRRWAPGAEGHPAP